MPGPGNFKPEFLNPSASENYLTRPTEVLDTKHCSYPNAVNYVLRREFTLPNMVTVPKQIS